MYPILMTLAFAASASGTVTPSSDVPWASLPQRPFAAEPDDTQAFSYEPTAAIIYITGDGVSLNSNCGEFNSHSALGCSSLIAGGGAVEAPPWPSKDGVAQVFATASEQFEAYNAVFTAARPPQWIPYTMIVMTDGAPLGQSQNCGIVRDTCDGTNRRSIGFLFQGEGGCSTSPTRFIAKSLAQIFGLETNDVPEDFLYHGVPNLSAEFIDECLQLTLDAGECSYAHEQYCDELQQNSHQELLGVLGPREVDDQPPVIVSIFPEDGANIEADQVVLITAEVEENSNFIAGRWSLTGGGQEIDRCTNEVCDFDYTVPLGRDVSELNWDFLELEDAPLGEYVLTFDVADAYGGLASRTITFNIVEPGFNESGSSSGSSSDTDDDSDSTSGSTTSEPASSMGDETGPSMGTTGVADGSSGSADADSTMSEEDGCGCRSGNDGVPGFLALGLFALLRRRRRA